MWSNLIIILSMSWFVIVSTRAEFLRGRNHDGAADNVFHTKKRVDSNRQATTTGRSTVGDAVVEKFVETLMSSERYLKMIESVERKMNHLDTTFHERTNSILKYLSEMLRMIKTSSSELLEKALRNVKTDLDKLKHTMTERIDDHPTMRGKIFKNHCYEIGTFSFFLLGQIIQLLLPSLARRKGDRLSLT